MATCKNLPLLLLLLSLSLLTVSTTARPCKTIFFFTSTSYYPIPTNTNPNPNLNIQQYPTFFFTRFKEPSVMLGGNTFFFNRIGEEEEDRIVEGDEGDEYGSNRFSLSSMVTTSVRDRTKDIIRVMGAMIFGIGCGALTAVTMYLIWSLFWPTSFDFEDSDDDFDDDNDDDDDVNPKKIGYVVLPTKVVDDDDDLKKPAKEVV